MRFVSESRTYIERILPTAPVRSTILWYFSGLQALGVGTAATYMALIPVCGVLISTIWLGEPLTLFSLFEAVLVMIGRLLMNWTKQTHL